ncbi:MAG: nitrilase-related carbon-nitrogen hydrolase [Armatimonadota bacterium]
MGWRLMILMFTNLPNRITSILPQTFLTQPNNKEMNVSYLISPDGKVVGRCEKQHLFGKELLEFMRSKEECPAISDGNGLKVGIPTCYDTMFTDVIRNYVRDGARLILVPNSDPEAPNHFFAKMHAGITAFRAAENGVPVVMADTGSISTIFNKSGGVVGQSEYGKPSYVIKRIYLRDGVTLYNRIGDIVAYLCISFILMSIYYLKKKNNSHNPDPHR